MTDERDGTGDGGPPVVLAVEDEADVAETYELWLADTYEVRRAATGRAALEAVDEEVDVVLLDRMMPEMSGDEVLVAIREAAYDCRVAMVSAVDPDFDIIAMGFDAYVTKPPTREGLRDVVADLLERQELTETLREYRALVSKRAALAGEKSDAELAGSESFAELEARIDALADELDEVNERLLDDDTFISVLRDLTDGGGEDRAE